MSSEERASELLDLYWDGLLAEEGRRELEAILAESEPARKLFLQSARLHASLRLSLKTSDPAASVRRTRAAKARYPGLGIALGAAAALAIALLGILVATRPRPARPAAETAERKSAPPVPAPVPRPPDNPVRTVERPPEAPPPPVEVPRPAPPPEKPPAPPRDPAEPAPPPREPAPAPPPRETRAAVADLTEVKGTAWLLEGPERAAARAGGALLSGQGLETGTPGGAVLKLPDGTRVELMPGTSIGEAKSARMNLRSGALAAQVVRRPPGDPLVFSTPHAEMTVLGTALRILVEADRTRLEVAEGKVRLRRTLDGRSVDVAAGQFAVAEASRGELAARPLPTALEALAARMEPGSWAELATEGFGQRLLDVGGAQSVLLLAEEAAWDPGDRRLHVLGYAGPDSTKHVVYEEKANSWRNLPAPGLSGIGNAYDHVALDPKGRRLYFRRYNSASVHELDLAKGGAWQPLPPMPGNPTIIGALEFFPELGGPVFAGGGAVYLYQPGAQRWKILAQGLPMAGYNNFAEVDTLRKVMVFGGGNGSRDLHRLDASGKPSKLRGEAPIPPGQLDSIVVADPSGGRILVLSRKEDGRFFEFDALSERWSPLPAPPVQVMRPSRGGQTAAASLPTHGVVIFLTYDFDESKVYLYKPQKRGSK